MNYLELSNDDLTSNSKLSSIILQSSITTSQIPIINTSPIPNDILQLDDLPTWITDMKEENEEIMNHHSDKVNQMMGEMNQLMDDINEMGRRISMMVNQGKQMKKKMEEQVNKAIQEWVVEKKK